jgi:hypothetical protein
MSEKRRESMNNPNRRGSLGRHTTTAALVQHVKVELALADLAAIVVETLHQAISPVRTHNQISIHNAEQSQQCKTMIPLLFNLDKQAE